MKNIPVALACPWTQPPPPPNSLRGAGIIHYLKCPIRISKAGVERRNNEVIVHLYPESLFESPR